MYKRILTAVNEHLNSEIAARYAMNLAKGCWRQTVSLLCCRKGQQVPIFDRAEEAMKRIFIDAKEMAIDVEAITETGDPVKKISEIVRHEEIDIAFAATRREMLKKILCRDSCEGPFIGASMFCCVGEGCTYGKDTPQKNPCPS